ncbi:MAG: hypothetical protein COV01_01570 [Candidatus Taylorbacteria bacterium CG10_big_fil_rev_8_21_14_0_10_41_48]|uniref:Pilus assembly protein PilO n=1 Tax=Candidatus Taylorbacteria bacterium CG10_big_fil_rev_8_21_14_0_10_41_48 TaxID=1975024 RepID=A0A2M8LC24_9BACT|nr:MAG: hypothetical protein COV01_01570 [Candidatus Taylorbacteria bacterium CG10_big_fil_rev_8_21_14_0_10_41_48]
MRNITAIILILASIGLFFGYIDGTYSDVKELRIEQADYDRALSNSKELQAERDKLLAKFNNIGTVDLDKLNKLLPDNIDNVRLVIDVDNIASNYGMRIRNFKTETGDKVETVGVDQTPYGTLTLSFSTTASYTTFLAFLHDIEESLRLIDITSVQFNSSDLSQLYDYSVSIKTYWLK